MRLSWSEHLRAARTLETSSVSELGSSLSLMGMALLMLAEDLLDREVESADGRGGHVEDT